MVNLKEYLLSAAKHCIHEAAGQLPFRFVTPSTGVIAGNDDNEAVSKRSLTGHYLQMYDWDSCFFAQMGARLGIPELAFDVIGNFLALQEENGQVPRTISPQRIWDTGDHCKPFLCQTLHAAVIQAPSLKSFITADLLNKLSKYLEYFDKYRQSANGLYHWRNVLESGVDNNLALMYPLEASKDTNDNMTEFPDGQVFACDLLTYLAAEYEALAALHLVAQDPPPAAKYSQKAGNLKDLLEKYFWDQEASFFFNLAPDGKTKIRVLSWTGFTPLIYGFAGKEKAEQLIKQHITNEASFLRKSGITSMSALERTYNQAKRGLYGRFMVSNWQGPVWGLTTALAIRGLQHYKYEDSACEIAGRWVNTLSQSLKRDGTLYENYYAETGDGLWAPDFISWNILALESLELLNREI